MILPSPEETRQLLEKHIQDPYQRLHAVMVATAMEGNVKRFNEDAHLWWVTGLMRDLDFEVTAFKGRHWQRAPLRSLTVEPYISTYVVPRCFGMFFDVFAQNLRS
jgi:predicted hydrolase (HD superfamily)